MCKKKNKIISINLPSELLEVIDRKRVAVYPVVSRSGLIVNLLKKHFEKGEVKQ